MYEAPFPEVDDVVMVQVGRRAPLSECQQIPRAAPRYFCSDALSRLKARPRDGLLSAGGAGSRR